MKTAWPIPMLLSMLMAACAGQPAQLEDSLKPELTFSTRQFGQSQEIIPVEDIFLLSEPQQKAFLTYFNDPRRWDIAAHERVWNYLQEITMNFGYQGETYAADEALRTSSGNCLSLAILTTALAKLAEVETGYQLVDSAPVFESQGNIVYKAQHVRTKLFQPPRQYDDGEVLLSRGGLLVDYFPSERDRFVSNISENEYITMYYNNLAGEAIAREDYNAAFWITQKALELAPGNASSINAMAIVHRRVGDPETAEEIYRYGIERLDDNVSLLRNYRVLLEQQGRSDEVVQINRRLAALDDPSPFDWLHAGHGAFSDGNFEEAVLFYRKAAKIAPYLHESYAWMAKAYYKTGNRKSAEREFRNALQYSQRPSTRAMYEAKLLALGNSY